MLYKTIWGEVAENRDLVFSDKINRLICPACGNVAFPATSLMYTNCDLCFAVYYEPEHDPQIDADNNNLAARELGQRRGAMHLFDAIRLPEWEQFKEMIRKYERGDLVTETYKLKQARQLVPPPKKGCMGVVIMAAVVCLAVLLIRIIR